MSMQDELDKARRMGDYMDAVIAALARPRREPEVMYEYTIVCPKCGTHELGMSRVQPEHAEYSGLCRQCSVVE